MTGLQKTGSPEVVSVTGSGDLTDWYVISVTGNQRFDFPDGFVLNGTVQVHSAVPQFSNSASTLWWTGANVWNNSEEDDAALYDCNGQLASYWDD